MGSILKHLLTNFGSIWTTLKLILAQFLLFQTTYWTIIRLLSRTCLVTLQNIPRRLWCPRSVLVAMARNTLKFNILAASTQTFCWGNMMTRGQTLHFGILEESEAAASKRKVTLHSYLSAWEWDVSWFVVCPFKKIQGIIIYLVGIFQDLRNKVNWRPKLLIFHRSFTSRKCLEIFFFSRQLWEQNSVF